MKIENIFTLSFGFSDVFISNEVVIDENTGAIEYTSSSVNTNSCSSYEGIRGRYWPFTYYPIKFVTVSDKLSDKYETGKLFYYDKNKKLLGKIPFTINSTITIPVDNAIFVAFLLDQAQITYNTKDFCEMSTIIEPHYKSLKKQYKKESNQMFFRESIDGKIHLFGKDYEKVKNTNLDDMMTFNIYQNGSLFATNTFNKTDCKFDHFKKSVELKLTPRDKYTNILDKYDKTYDLIKLAVGKTSIKLTKRSIIQIYIQGGNTITNYSGGTYWEDEVTSVIDSQSTLLSKYHFSKGPIFKEVSLSGFNYDINTAFACTDNDCWNGTATVERDGVRYKLPCSIKFTKIASAHEFTGSYSPSGITALSDGVSEAEYQMFEDGPYYYQYDTYRIDIYTGDNGTGRRIYSSARYYGKDGAFTLKQGANLYPMRKVSQDSPSEETDLLLEPEPASFNLGDKVVEYQIWGRLLCDVDVNSEGQTLYDLPYDDFATERANFRKCIGLTFTQSNHTLVHFFQKQDVQDEPTPWGINDFGQYFTAPVFGFGTQLFPYPLARSTWANTSLWIAFEQDEHGLNLEEMCQKFYKKIWHKDCMELGAIIKALLSEIDPSIKFESTAEYSDFFYGTTYYGYGKKGIRTYLTQKSNVLEGEYDQAAQKAEITFKKLMNLLRDCFRCYWFIDSDGRFRIEHVMYFMRGMNYSSPTMQYNLVNKVDKFNKKPVLYSQQEISFAKSELNSRYEFAWADDVTECMGGGFAVDVDSSYIQKDKTENINIELATPDIDMMMFAPSKFSQDGFAIIMAKDYEVQIVRNIYYDQRYTYNPIVTYIQNYHASFLSLFQHYMYDMPASSIHTTVDKSKDNPTYNVSNIKRCMKHDIEYQAIYDPDVYKLIGTDIGKGYVDYVSIDIDTRSAKVTLTYEPM